MAVPTVIGAGTAQFQATNTQSIPTMAPPDGAVGDLLLLFLVRNDATAAPAAPAGGWTALAALTGTNSTTESVGTYYKYATSATGATDATGAVAFGSGTVVRGGFVLRIAGTVSSGDPTNTSSITNVASTATTMTATNITSTLADTLGVFVALPIGLRATTNTVANWSTAISANVQTTALGNDLTFGWSTLGFPVAGSYLTPGVVWTTNTTTGVGVVLLLAVAALPSNPPGRGPSNMDIQPQAGGALLRY